MNTLIFEAENKEQILSIIPDKYNDNLLEMRRLIEKCLKLKEKTLILNKVIKQ